MVLPLVISPGDLGHISHHEEIHDLLSDATSPFVLSLFASGTLAARPAAGVNGRFYIATDEGVLYRDTGSSWVAIWNYFATASWSLLAAAPTVAEIIHPSAVLQKNASQSIPDGILTETVVTFETEASSTTGDNDDMHPTSGFTGRITCRRTGYYIFGASITFQANGTGAREVRLRKNGTDTEYNTDDPASTSRNYFQCIGGFMLGTIGDYVEVTVGQSSTAALNVLAGSRFWGIHLSDLS